MPHAAHDDTHQKYEILYHLGELLSFEEIEDILAFNQGDSKKLPDYITTLSRARRNIIETVTTTVETQIAEVA